MKSYQTKLSLTFACGLALAALPSAFAGSDDDKFKLMDTDADGRISRDEHEKGAETMFARMDADSDGNVTLAEMEATHDMKDNKSSKLKFWDKNDDMPAAEKLRAIDLDADGKVTRNEHERMSEAMFLRMDTNNDGFVSKDEFEKGHKEMKKHAK